MPTNIILWVSGPNIPQAGVHDQQLPERGRHPPEGKLAFDLLAEVKQSRSSPPDKHQFQTHPDIILEDT